MYMDTRNNMTFRKGIYTKNWAYSKETTQTSVVLLQLGSGNNLDSFNRKSYDLDTPNSATDSIFGDFFGKSPFIVL